MATVPGWLSQCAGRRREVERAFRDQVRARNVENVSGLAALSDAELIATNPGIGNVTHEMEMTRRLKVAIAGLTAETIPGEDNPGRMLRIRLPFQIMTS